MPPQDPSRDPYRGGFTESAVVRPPPAPQQPWVLPQARPRQVSPPEPEGGPAAPSQSLWSKLLPLLVMGGGIAAGPGGGGGALMGGFRQAQLDEETRVREQQEAFVTQIQQQVDKAQTVEEAQAVFDWAEPFARQIGLNQRNLRGKVFAPASRFKRKETERLRTRINQIETDLEPGTDPNMVSFLWKGKTITLAKARSMADLSYELSSTTQRMTMAKLFPTVFSQASMARNPILSDMADDFAPVDKHGNPDNKEAVDLLNEAKILLSPSDRKALHEDLVARAEFLLTESFHQEQAGQTVDRGPIRKAMRDLGLIENDADWKAELSKARRAAEPAAGDEPKQFQLEAASFFDRGVASDEKATELEASITIADLLVPDFMRGQRARLYFQAVREFTEARMREASGAAIPQEEFDRDYKTYFKEPRDGPEVLAQKREARRRAIRGFERTAGPAIDRRPTQDLQSFTDDELLELSQNPLADLGKLTPDERTRLTQLQGR